MRSDKLFSAPHRTTIINCKTENIRVLLCYRWEQITMLEIPNFNAVKPTRNILFLMNLSEFLARQGEGGMLLRLFYWNKSQRGLQETTVAVICLHDQNESVLVWRWVPLQEQSPDWWLCPKAFPSPSPVAPASFCSSVGSVQGSSGHFSKDQSGVCLNFTNVLLVLAGVSAF